MRKFTCVKFLIALSLLATSTIASAYYFFDQGIQTAVVRTDYDSTNEGTSANPITVSNTPLYPCPDDAHGTKCVSTNYTYDNYFYAPTTFSQAFPWSFNGGSTANKYWVLSLNNEHWFYHRFRNDYAPVSGDAYNPGAPNLSLPRSAPGYGIMGFLPIIWTEGGEDFYRFNLVLNHLYPNPIDEIYPDLDHPGKYLHFLGIPFMSIGADAYRGNGGILGYMNYYWYPSTVEWTSTVWDEYENNQENYWAQTHLFITTAIWGGKTRMIQVALYHESNLDGKELHFSDPSIGKYGVHQHWNFQVQESFWYPGADIALMDAEDIETLCGFSMTRLRNKNQSANYSVVLDDLYRCASDLGLFDEEMPQQGVSAVPITGVHWANELTGTGIALWTSVHDMRMELSPTYTQTQLIDVNYPNIEAAANEDSTKDASNEGVDEISLIKQRLRASCMNIRGCWEENKQYIDGRPRKRTDNPNIYVGTIQNFIDEFKVEE